MLRLFYVMLIFIFSLLMRCHILLDAHTLVAFFRYFMPPYITFTPPPFIFRHLLLLCFI